MKDYMTIYKEWLENPYFDEATKEELRAIEGDENEIKERFYMDLEFGTAGLRGIIGAGINRMNIIHRPPCDQADWQITSSSRAARQKAWRSHLTFRHMSPEFAEEAALTLAANGIKAYRFETLRPTPELSFCSPRAWLHRRHQHHRQPQPAWSTTATRFTGRTARWLHRHDKGVTEEVMAITDLFHR